MSQLDGVPRQMLTGPTLAYQPAADSRSVPPCRVVAHCGATGSQFHSEIENLLRSRLRMVSLLLLAPTVFFLAKRLVDLDLELSESRIDCLFQTIVMVILAALVGVVWFRPCLDLRKLRGIELALFAVMSSFFVHLQYEAFHSPEVYEMARTPQQELLALRLVAGASSLRWFFLIVLYGAFIPCSWRRCAGVVGSMVLAALAVTALAAYRREKLDAELISALGDMLGFLLTGAAVAVFGSYRLHFLQRQAFTAQQLGQYRLKKKLGAGGMGEVYLAEHLLLRRPCAVKLIRPEQTIDPTNLQRFEREVRAMATLTHWNTVEVFDYGRADDGTFYYVMEYLPGRNLETLVARHGPLPPARVIHYLRQVCQALREAHGIGLLHRDIKPSNVIACDRGGVADVVKLLDFGLVQDIGLSPLEDKLTVQGTILGSPPYMSPEQAAGRAGLDGRSDIYSVGAVAYYLLTGRPPFQKETPLEMLMAHAYETPVPPPGAPDDLVAIVLRCLSKKPADRFGDVEALEKALAECQSAGEWTEALARAWWDEHGTDGGQTAALDAVPTRVTSPAPVTA